MLCGSYIRYAIQNTMITKENGISAIKRLYWSCIIYRGFNNGNSAYEHECIQGIIMDDNECLNCEFCKFGNLYKKITDTAGGELFVLNESIKRKKLMPCQSIYFLDLGFNMWKNIFNSLRMNGSIEELDSDEIYAIPPIVYATYQSFFDLKASAFLAFTAHYRSAIQLLRPILENIIVSRYFQEKIRNSNNENKMTKEYENFLNWFEQDNHEEGFNKSIQYLNKERIINSNSEEQKRIKIELWDELNKYMHPYMCRWDKSDNPEIVCYNEDWFNEWLDLYQNILSYMIEMLCLYFPGAIKTQAGRDTLNELNGIESLEKECDIVLIKSKYLKKFISRISLDAGSYEIGLPNSDLGLPNMDESSKL